MLTPQALAQDKGVLRPNGHDQAQAQKQALGKDRPSPSNTCWYTHVIRAVEREMIQKRRIVPGLTGCDGTDALAEMVDLFSN
jgi:hypothetical protein